MPSTPVSPLRAESEDILEELIELPEAEHAGTGFPMPEPQYNWFDKDLNSNTSFDVDFTLPPRSTEQPQRLVRPQLKRRDSPRPACDLLNLSPKRSSQRKLLKSALDGSAWVIME